jgi:CubicO group peptidase (beta-lactamase class C family)
MMSAPIHFNCLKVSLVAAFLLFYQVSDAQLNVSDLDAIVAEKTRILKSEAILLVATKDTVVYQKDTRAFSAVRGKAPIGTASQLLTTALILQLADEGKLSLDDKIAQYLPAFARYGKNYITIRHCLTHQTGIQADTKGKAFESMGSSLEAAVDKIAAREIQSNPGTEFRYNDRGYLVAARIAEVVTKKKFETLIQQKLTRPLGMRQTSFLTLDGSAPNPSNGASSSAADMIIFMRMLLNGGAYKGAPVLSEGAIAEFRKIYVDPSGLKGAPKALLSYDHALGAWATDVSAGKAGALAGFSQGGTVATVDFCRGYAFVYFLKELNEDKKADAFADIKSSLDSGLPASCKE